MIHQRTFIPWFIIAGIACVFGYHLFTGWRTKVVRFALSILAIEEFDREHDAASYWGIMVLNLVGLIGCVGGAAYIGFQA